MTGTKKQETVIAVVVQEPAEGINQAADRMQGDELGFLHQAFIADSVIAALRVPGPKVRLFYTSSPEHKRVVDSVTHFLKNKSEAAKEASVSDRLEVTELPDVGWGERIDRVFSTSFQNGVGSVLVLGTHSPTLTPTMIKTALKLLKASDAVFGPTPEGRYYTIGMSGAYHIPLAKHDWDAPTIYHDIAEAFSKKKLSWSELEIWYTVGTSDDLELMVRDINQYRFEGDEQTARETELVMERLITRL